MLLCSANGCLERRLDERYPADSGLLHHIPGLKF